MLKFSVFLKEEEEQSKLKHIDHAEDRPLLKGSDGFNHAVGALKQAHEHIKSKKNNSNLTMKYDGSPSIVFGHHPENGKFFVASKSAFNKTPKINYTHEDIHKNHGHAPGLKEKLGAALDHLHKVVPKHGVYQGDMMHSHTDLKSHKDSVSFTPNTITYTAHGSEAKKIKNSKVGVVVHQKYEGKTLDSMKATPHPDYHNFKQHKDVWHKSGELDTSKVHYSPDEQKSFEHHISEAEKLHKQHGKSVYKSTEKHQGESGHLVSYINQTVRKNTSPSVDDFKNHVKNVYDKKAEKLKTQASKDKQFKEGSMHIDHIEKNKKHYDNMFKIHQHLQKAKNVLVKNLNQQTGGLDHHIEGNKTDPEGFVVNHVHNGKSEPTKLVNRAEFARANLLRVRK